MKCILKLSGQHATQSDEGSGCSETNVAKNQKPMIAAIACPFFVVGSIVTHAFVDSTAATSIALRWKPQSVSGAIVPTSPIDSYVKARIVLAKTDGASGAILSEDMNLFAVRHNRAHDNCGYICVEACLWRRRTYQFRVEAFRELREWVAHNLPDHEIHCNLCTATERALWYASE